MKGLLLKDLYIAKSNILVIIGSLIVLGFGLSVLIEASASFGFWLPPCATTAVFISITTRCKLEWSKNVITMPVSRSQIIGEKFILFIILSVLGIMAALIPCGVLAIFGAEITLASLLLYGSIGVSAALFAGCFSLPCAYFFDPDKSQIVFLMSFLASTGIIVALVLLINLFIPVKGNILLPFNIVLIIAAIFFFVSHKIAVMAYQEKDIT